MSIDTPESLFRASQAHLSRAELASFHGREADWREATEKAYVLQAAAAGLLKKHLGAEPTRSIVHQSAAALAMRLGYYEASIELCDEGMNGTPDDYTMGNIIKIKNMCLSRIRDGQA